VSAADTNRPDTVQPSGCRPQLEKQQTATAYAASSAAAGQTPAAVSGCPAGCGRTAADPQPPLRRDGSAEHVRLARRRWSRGPGRRSRPVPAVRTRGHRPPPAGHRKPVGSRRCAHPRPPQGHPDTAAADTLDSRQPRRPPPQPVSDRNETATCGTGRPDRPTARPPDRQIRRLVITVDLVGSRHIWPAQVGCLVDPDGSRRILWIRGMIKRPGAEHHSRPGGSARLPSGPILTMEPPGTAVRTAVLAGHARPSGRKLSVHSTRSYGFSYRRGDRRPVPDHDAVPDRLTVTGDHQVGLDPFPLPPPPWPGWARRAAVGAGLASPRPEPSTQQVS
jgi:hypothetical protein